MLLDLAAPIRRRLHDELTNPPRDRRFHLSTNSLGGDLCEEFLELRLDLVHLEPGDRPTLN